MRELFAGEATKESDGKDSPTAASKVPDCNPASVP
jgi:hypothetical protein